MEGRGCRLCNIHHFPLKCHTVFFLHCAQHTHRVARASSSSSSPFSSAFHTCTLTALLARLPLPRHLFLLPSIPVHSPRCSRVFLFLVTFFFCLPYLYTHRVARASSSSSSPFSSAFHTCVFPALVMMQIWVCAVSPPPPPHSVVHKAVLFGHVSRPVSVYTVMLTYFCPYSHLPPSP